MDVPELFRSNAFNHNTDPTPDQKDEPDLTLDGLSFGVDEDLFAMAVDTEGLSFETEPVFRSSSLEATTTRALLEGLAEVDSPSGINFEEYQVSMCLSLCLLCCFSLALVAHPPVLRPRGVTGFSPTSPLCGISRASRREWKMKKKSLSSSSMVSKKHTSGRVGTRMGAKLQQSSAGVTRSCDAR
jgi:hypothetical protein